MPAAGFLWELSKSKGKFWLARGPLFVVNVHAVWYLCNNNIGGDCVCWLWTLST